uniref:non-specific serine/threonine protein kinase n=2 Tax=Astyanax mexicanus TaxID=7994 RepID=W5KLL9_ASTMX
MNGTSEKSLEGEYIFTNGKWTILLKPVRVAGDSCPVNSRKEMTAAQVSKGMQDDLLSSAIHPATSVESSVHVESSHVVDQHGQVQPNTSATMADSELDSTADIQATDTIIENVLDIDTVQPPDQTVSVGTTSRFGIEVEEDEANIGNLDLTDATDALNDTGQFGNDGASLSSIQAEGDTVSQGEDMAERSQPTAVKIHSHADDVLESIKDKNVTVQPVVFELSVFQDVVVDDSRSDCISESQDLPKTISTGLIIKPDHQDNSVEVVAQNVDQNSFDLVSMNQETNILENTPPTFRAVSSTIDSIQTKDQPQARHLTSESSAIANIPDTNFEIDRIPETHQDVMTGVDSVGQGATVCNTEQGNLIKTDPEICGIFEETVHNISLEISGIVQGGDCHIGSEISDSAVDTPCNLHSEVSDIIGKKKVAFCSSSAQYTHGIDSEISANVAMTAHDTDSDLTVNYSSTMSGKVGETVDSMSLEISGIVQGSVGHISSETHDSTMDSCCRLDPEIRDIVGEVEVKRTISNTGEEMYHEIKRERSDNIPENTLVSDSEVSDIVDETTSQISCTEVGANQNIVSEVNNVIGKSHLETVCNTDSKIGHIIGESSICGSYSEISSNVATTDYCTLCKIKDNVELALPNTDSKKEDITGSIKLNSESDECDSPKEDLTVDHPSTNKATPVPESDSEISEVAEESGTGGVESQIDSTLATTNHSPDCKKCVGLAVPNTDSEIDDIAVTIKLKSDSDVCNSPQWDLTVDHPSTNKVTPLPKSDSEMSGIAEETVENISLEICGIVQDNVCHIDFEIHDSTIDSACKFDPEIAGIVGEVEVKTTISNTAEEISHETEPERSNTIAKKTDDADSEARNIVEETTSQMNCEEVENSQNIDSGVDNVIEESHLETVSNTGSKIGYIFEKSSTGGVESEVGATIGPTDHSSDSEIKDSIGLTVPNTDSKIDDIAVSIKLNSDSDVCDSPKEDLTVDHPSINKVTHVPESDSEISEIVEDTVDNINLKICGIVQDSVCHIDSEMHDSELVDSDCKIDAEIGNIVREVEFETTVSNTAEQMSHEIEPERVLDTGSEVRDIVEEITSQISQEAVETIQNIDFGEGNIIMESHLETLCNTCSEIVYIVGESSMGAIDSEISSNVATTDNCTDCEIDKDTIRVTDSEVRNIAEETSSQINCTEVEANQNIDSKLSNIIEESHSKTDSAIGAIVATTDQYTDLEIKDHVELSVSNKDYEIDDKTVNIKVISNIRNSQSQDMTIDSSYSSSTNTVNPVNEIPVIVMSQQKPALEMNKPVTVCDSPVLKNPSPQPSLVESNDNNVEGDGNNVTILDPAILNSNAMPADSLTDSTFNFLANVLTPPQNLAEESDLDMLSSTFCRQEYPVPHLIPMLQLESKTFHSNDPTVDNLTENSPDTHLQIPSFPHTSIESPQISEEAETDLPPQDLGHPPAAVQDSEAGYKWFKGDVSGSEVTDDARYSNQLWTEADAGPFLVFEENKGSIFDEWGHTPDPSPPRASPDNTNPLAYSQGREAAIGQLVGDWELPPIERWSSSDSWASALSDWFQSVSAFTEDSPLVVTTTSCSSPVDSLCLPYLASQDTTEEQKSRPNISSTSGQICPPSCSMEAGEDSQSRRVPKDDNSNGLVQQLADKDLHLHTHIQPYTASSKDLTDLTVLADSVVPQQEKNMEVETVKPYGAYMPKHMGSHVQEEKVVSVLPMKDYSKGKAANQQTSRTKESDAVWGVAEDRTSQLSPDFEEESVRNHGTLKVSDYPNDKKPTAESVCGPCFETYPPPPSPSPQLGGHVRSELEHLTHAGGVSHCAHSRSCTEGNWSHVSLYTKDSEVSQGEGRSGDPMRFIMPFAPISTGTSFYYPSAIVSSKPSLIGLTNELRVDPTGFLLDTKPASGEESSDDQFHTCSDKSREQTSASSCVDSEDSQETSHKSDLQKARDLGQELSKLILLSGQRFMVSEKKRVAYVTLDLDDPLNFNKDTSLRCDQGVPSSVKQANCEKEHNLHANDDNTMPQKTPKTSSEGKARSKHKVDKGDYSKMTGSQLGIPIKKQEKVRPEPQVEAENECLGSGDSTVTVIETIVITEKVTPKPQGVQKKKKKPGMAKPESEPLAEVENGARPKATKVKIQGAEDSPTPKPLKTAKEKPALPLISKINAISTDSSLKTTGMKQLKETEAVNKPITAKIGKTPCGQESQSTCLPNVLDDDVIKRRRISEEKSEAAPIRTRPQLPAIFRQKKEEDVPFKKAYSDVVKQKIQTHKEAVVVPHVVAEIQAAPVPEDPQSISLWCQFSLVAAESFISWTKEGKILTEMKRGAGDDSRVTLSILKACSKDLGMYRCTLTSPAGTVSTSEYHLTSEVLMELVLPSHDTPAERHEVEGDEESVHCAPLLFRNDILTEQYFGDNQAASIVTEKAHFGEGMHRKAFRTTLRAGMGPAFNPGHPCVLKVHNSITYGTKNNEELVQKNYNLAVEECHVQNTAREYIKAYTTAAKTTESFGEVPEIIPIYLVHRPSSDIPYATLEEELIGDFVKYSVKDGKEINLMRRDSEAGQKCCAFQHWVYSQTEGNLLVTDMQGVGMRLTDVGIATCKKGYKGFKGNCATTFIDQFKALHQCNRFCELLGLTSLQPKPKRTVAPPKPKTQPAPKKKTCGPVLKSKS